jgi:hypothetical protein
MPLGALVGGTVATPRLIIWGNSKWGGDSHLSKIAWRNKAVEKVTVTI